MVLAYVGDPVVFRNLVSGANEVHTFHLDGHWFRVEPHSAASRPVNTVNVGISERFDIVVPAAGGPQRKAGDYLFSAGRQVKLREGSWGILRVLEPKAPGGPQPLPGRTPAGSAPGSVCPDGAPRRRFSVAAEEAELPMLDGKAGRVFVVDRARSSAVEPLVLRATVGDCIEVHLTNRLPHGSVSFHTDLLAADPATSGGVATGHEPRQAVDPGGTATFTFYAHPEVGPTTAMVRDMADPYANTAIGLYGAIVIAPRGSQFLDPTTGRALQGDAGWDAVVAPPRQPRYRDMALFLQDEDPAIGTHRMPYAARVTGVVGLNYRKTPLGDEPAEFPPAATTPLLRANSGDRIQLHVLAPWSEQFHVFGVEGHRWRLEPARKGSDLVDAAALGGLGVLELDFAAGMPGSYLYGDHREPFHEAGLWGSLVVEARCKGDLRPMSGSCAASRAPLAGMASAAAVVFAGAFVATARRRRRSR
jgi:hypothetical protein